MTVRGVVINSKTITAITGLVLALAGGVELRLKVGSMSDRLDRVERTVERIAREEGLTYARNTP